MWEEIAKDYITYVKSSEVLSGEYIISKEEKNVLDKINQKVAGGQSLDEIMNFLFENALSPCDRLGLSFLDEGGNRVTAHWARVKYKDIFLKKGFWEALSGSSLEKIIKTGEVRIINDLKNYSKEHPDSISTKLILKEGLMSSMTCPLKVDDRAVGFLFLSSVMKNAYDMRHVKMHAIVAERLTQAVEKAYRIEQLLEANRAYMEMLAFVSHEIKNPLSSIIMDSDLLINGYLGELRPEQAEKIKKLETKARYLLELTKDYLNLARIEGGKLEPEIKVTELKSLLDETLSILETQIKEKKSNIECEFRNTVRAINCDPELIRIVLINLIGNAVKYGNEGGRIKILIWNDEKEIIVSVWNEGPGFSKEDKGLLFRKFSRLKRQELLRQKGSGVGLYTVWQIVNAHKGRVFADSDLGNWAEFRFSLPIKN